MESTKAWTLQAKYDTEIRFPQLKPSEEKKCPYIKNIFSVIVGV